MAQEIKVAKILTRTGLKASLPQPLSPGEFGTALDTGEVFIGLNPTNTAANNALPIINCYTSVVDSQTYANQLIGTYLFQVNLTNPAITNADIDAANDNNVTAGFTRRYVKVANRLYISYEYKYTSSVLDIPVLPNTGLGTEALLATATGIWFVNNSLDLSLLGTYTWQDTSAIASLMNFAFTPNSGIKTGLVNVEQNLRVLTEVDLVSMQTENVPVISVNGIKNLQPLVNTVQCVSGFYVDADEGGGQLVYRADVSKALHNGGTIIAPEAIAAWNGTPGDVATLLNWTGPGNGCYVRGNIDGMYDVTWFGATGDYLNYNDSYSIQAAIDTIQEDPNYNLDSAKMGFGGTVFFPPGRYHAQGLRVSKFNIQIEGIAGASFIVNKSTTLDVLSAAWNSGASTIGGMAFVDIEIINIVDRADGAPPLVTLDKAVRSHFRGFKLTSSDFNTGPRISKKADGIKLIAPFELFGDIVVYGFNGIGMDVISGPQSDSFELNGIFMYNTVGLVGFRGAGGSGNNNFKFTGKFLGSQGGFYVSTNQDAYAETAVVSTSGNTLTVTDTINMKVGRAVVVGRTNTLEIAIIKSIAGNTLTLDRPITLPPGEMVLSGRFGCITSEMRNPKFSGIQFEGCDVGLYSTVGTTRLVVSEYSASSCSKAFVFNGRFRKATFENGVAAANGTLVNGVAWKFITLLDIEDRFNYLYLLDNPAEGSAYYTGTRASLIDNRSGYMPYQQMENRIEGTVYDAKNSQPAVTFEDNTYLTFSRTATNKFTRASWKEGVTDKWYLDFTRANGDLEFRLASETVGSISFSGANGIPTLGDGVWNNIPTKIGTQYFWVDSDTRLRVRNGAPTSEFDGKVIGNYSSAWDSTSKLILGAYRIWVDATGKLRTKSSEPTSDTDGTIIGTQS